MTDITETIEKRIVNGALVFRHTSGAMAGKDVVVIHDAFGRK